MVLCLRSFIIAVDYFQTRFPGSTIVFDMSLVYILTAFVAVLLNNLLVETLSLNTRINFGIFCALYSDSRYILWIFNYIGYAVSFITLLFVATCEIWWNIFGPELAYKANLIAVAVVALGCTGIEKTSISRIFYDTGPHCYFYSPAEQFLRLHQYASQQIYASSNDW